MSEFRALGVIRDDQLQAAANRFELGAVLKAELLGGAVGNNVGLSTTSGEWVLRGAVGDVTVESFERERFFARTVNAACTLAVPWPYLIDARADLFGWPYAIMRRLPGAVLHYQADVDWDAVGSELGRATAELDTVTFPRCGFWVRAVDDIVPVSASPSNWFAARVAALEHRVAETSIPLDASSSRFVADAIDAALPRIDGFQPCYVHGDLGVGNFTADTAGNRVIFTGVFDLGGGYAGDPDENLATSLWWPLYWRRPIAAASFIAGHRAVRSPRAGQDDRLRAYVVATMLTNWEVGRREKFNWYRGAETFVEWARPLVAEVDAILSAQ